MIFDIGCNLGQAALICMAAGPPRTLVLADPNPLALSIAAENMIHNGFASKVRMACAFVDARSEGKQKFYTVWEGAAGSRYAGQAKSAAKRNAFFEVEKVTLGELADLFGAPDLIKIDVEGAEASVLKGINDTALRKQPHLLVEVHSPPELPMVRNAERILDWCEGQGYKAFYLAGKIILEEPHPLASRGRCHLLLLPKDRAVPRWAREVPQGFPLDLLHTLALPEQGGGEMGTGEGARLPPSTDKDS